MQRAQRTTQPMVSRCIAAALRCLPTPQPGSVCLAAAALQNMQSLRTARTNVLPQRQRSLAVQRGGRLLSGTVGNHGGGVLSLTMAKRVATLTLNDNKKRNALSSQVNDGRLSLYIPCPTAQSGRTCDCLAKCHRQYRGQMVTVARAPLADDDGASRHRQETRGRQ